MQAHERKRFFHNDTCEIFSESQPQSLRNQIAVSERGSTDDLEPCAKMQRLRAISNRTKDKIMKILHVDGGGSPEIGAMSEESDAFSILERDPAFNPHMLNKQKPANTNVSTSKARETFRSIVTSVVHPKESLKNKAAKTTAGKLSNAERPYLSQEADIDFLNAHKDLDRAYLTRPSRQGTSDGEEDLMTNDCKGKVQEMEAHRESLRVAWMTSRHVSRVRVVPRRLIKFPSPSYFITGDISGHLIRTDFLKWLGHV